MSVIERLLEMYGGISALARVMQLDRQVVHNWKKNGRVPPRYAFEIEEMTKKKIKAREVVDENEAKLPRTRVIRMTRQEQTQGA